MNQYDNLANREAHYETTGPEIWKQTDGKITHLVIATGTGGTITGTAKFLKEKNPAIKILAVDVYGSLLKKYHETGEVDMKEVHPYITEGIGEDFVPANYDMSLIDKFELVNDKDGAVMARRISKEEGIFVGYSSGSALQGIMQLAKGSDGKKEFKKNDIVVVVFCDHGSRYVAKVYNDQWMMERGFLDVKTFKDLVGGRGTKRLVTIEPKQTVAEVIELMKKYDIENIPVMNASQNGDGLGEGIVGSLSESGLFRKILSNPEIKNQQVQSVMEKAYPIVPFDTPVERLSNLISKETGAVLSKDDSGNYHIVTKYDIIQSLVK
jgi:cystathionine beta-synthase